MVAFPPCKINLGLNVVRKRSDGYHDIETCFYPIPWTDILEVVPSKEFSFTVTGNVIPGSNDDNLCVRAYKLLRTPPVKIHLHKIIPTGAGLGGGSSDAAWTLRLLNDVFDLRLTKDQLRQHAAQLGSDCAFFIDDVPMMGRGRGEVLSPVNVSLKGKFIVIVKPGIHVSTVEAYSGVIPVESHLDIENIPVEDWKLFVKNDFERSIFEKYPVIKSVKDELYKAGAIYASMSGSGSAVYGIFSEWVDYEKDSNVNISFSGWL
jgi:4-diphosphocytidyl-2-C-methyl-D-erythritol kinase